MNYVFVFAIGIGIVAGLRSLLAPAVVAWAAHFEWLNLHASPLEFMGSTAAVAIFSIFAIGELIADKLPKTPKRTAFAPLLARVLMDRSIRRLRNPAASSEQSAHQRFLGGHLRRFGCDRFSVFSCFAKVKSAKP